MGDNRSEALFKAVGQGDIESVKGLLDDLKHIEIYNLLNIQKNECGSTVLHCAAGKGSPDMMRYMVASVSEDYNMYNLLMIQSQEGNTPVHWAAVYGRTETMRCIMDTVPYESVYRLLMVRNVKGFTPLHRVSSFGRVKILQSIVDFIADHDLINALMIRCNSRNTAAHIAVDCGYPNILECIVKSMPPEKAYNLLRLQNDEGHTVVHCAAHRGCTEILKSTLNCIKKSISSDDLLELLMIKCKLGQQTVVHLIAFTDEIEMMRCLLDPLTPDQRSQILNSKNVNGLTPWDVANQCEIFDMMTCIERYQNQESDTLANPWPLQTLHDDEQTAEEPQQKDARVEASLFEEISKRQEAEQQLMEVREELTQNIADLTSQNTTLENSLEEERHKREETEQRVVEDNKQTAEELQRRIEASLSEEIKRRQEIEQQLSEVREEMTQKIADVTSQNMILRKNLVEERQKSEETKQQVVEGEAQLRETDECRNRRKQESREVSELRILVQVNKINGRVEVLEVKPVVTTTDTRSENRGVSAVPEDDPTDSSTDSDALTESPFDWASN